jgi:hypothetical protein
MSTSWRAIAPRRPHRPYPIVARVATRTAVAGSIMLVATKLRGRVLRVLERGCHMGRGSTRRRLALTTAVGLGILALAIPGLAAVTGGCTGSATIDGVEYGPDNDTPANAIVIPDRDDVEAAWSGEVPFANTNFSGEAGIRVGPGVIRLADWEGANDEDVRSAAGQYSLDELRAALPVDVGVAGIYEVIVEHSADGGSCEANVFVKFEGNPLGTPLGLVSVVGLALSTLGMVVGMFEKGR